MHAQVLALQEAQTSWQLERGGLQEKLEIAHRRARRADELAHERDHLAQTNQTVPARVPGRAGPFSAELAFGCGLDRSPLSQLFLRC